MADARVVFSGWEPDAPPLSRGLRRAAGVIPVGAGYKPLGAWETVGASALNLFPRGALAARDLNGTGYNFVGTETKLYRIGPSGLQDLTRTSGAYTGGGSTQWEFLTTREHIIATNYLDDPQIFEMSLTSGNFARLSVDAPKAKHIGYIGPQIVLGNLNDPIIGVAPDAFRYPELGDPTNWPDPFDPDVALPLQAGLTVIEGEGGPIQGIVSGNEVGCIFQERQISRVEYVGGDVIFQVDRVEKTRGLLFPRLFCPFGRRVLFLAEDGFYLFDYTLAEPIGNERVDRFFLADFDQTYAHRAVMLKHTVHPIIAISYPGAGNVSGRPNRIIFWNFATNKWAGPTTFDHDLLVRVLPPALTLDSLPDDVLDDIVASFDDAANPVGSDQIGAYDTSHVLGTLSGSGIEAVFESPDQEHAPGQVSRVIAVRPLVDGAEPMLSVRRTFDRRELEEDVEFDGEVELNTAGEFPVRSKGRYHRYQMRIPAGGFDEAVGMDIEFLPAGRR